MDFKKPIMFIVASKEKCRANIAINKTRRKHMGDRQIDRQLDNSLIVR